MCVYVCVFVCVWFIVCTIIVYFSYRNPFEVTEKFIQDYNNAQSLQEKEQLDDAAFKMLQRIKVSHILVYRIYSHISRPVR